MDTITIVDFLKTVGGKIVTGLVALAVIASGISWFQMDAASRDVALSTVVRGGGWVVAVLVLPWALVWLIGRVARRDSNAAGAMLVAALTVVEAVWLLGLFGYAGHTATGWTMLATAVLLAGVYNLLACDWIAERVA